MNQKGTAVSLAAGLASAMLVMMALVVIVAAITTGYALKESSLTSAVWIIHACALAAGGFVTGRSRAVKGWYYGALLGLLYVAVLWLIGFLAYDAGAGMSLLAAVGICCVSGAGGGIIGVNTKR